MIASTFHTSLKNLRMFLLFIGIIIFVTVLSILYTKGCNNNVYDFTRGARMGTGIVVDTTKPKGVDSSKLEYRFYDSVALHTNIRDFQQWLYENVSAKIFQEGKFIELYNFYLQRKYQIYLQSKK